MTVSGGFAASADLYGVALNANESLALYGSTLQAAYYNGSAVENVEFSYVGNTFAVRDAYRQAGVIDSGAELVQVGYPFNGEFITSSIVENTNYLIYKWEVGENSFSPPASGGFRLRFEFPLDVQCSAFQSSILCTDDYGIFYRSQAGEYNYPSTNFYKLYDDDGTELSSHSFTPDSSRYPSTIGVLPFPVYVRDSGGLDSLYFTPIANGGSPWLPWFNGMGSRAGAITDDAPIINVHSGVYQLARLKPFRYPQLVQQVGDELVYLDYTEYSVYILIQCPIVYGDYVLPEPEDDTTLGDINENISSLVVSTDELRKILLRIESKQGDILTVERVHTNQFINIIDLLNNIYNRMAESGEISPELVDAQALTRYDSTGYFDSMRTGKPSASAIANFAAPIGAVGGVFSNLVSRAGVGAMAGVCVSLLVCQWVLKRGRGD